MLKFFRIPFALIGTRAAVPDVDPGDNSVNYEEGFTLPYELPKTNPASLNIPRNQTNQIYFDLSNELALLQAHGTPDYITSALNGGTPYAYSIGDRVRYDDGTNGPRVFVSRVDSNTALPTVAANWSPVRDAPPVGVAAGTANALTAALSPSLGLVPAGTLFYLRHAAANTGAATLALNGGPAKAIVRLNDLPLGAGDIPGAGSWGAYLYDLTLDKYVLLTAQAFASTAEAQAWTSLTRALSPGGLVAAMQGSNQSLAASGFQRLPGGTIFQWGTTASIASNASSGTLTFPVAFPNAAAYVNYIGTTPVTGGANTNQTLASKTAANFSFVNAYLSATPFNWLAVGY